MNMTPAFSLDAPPNWAPLPDYLTSAYKAWSLGDSKLINSQCGQSEFIYLVSRRISNLSKPYTYIDIGANDGLTESSTFLLSMAGWQGLCVEPQPRHFANLASRSEDSYVLNCAVGKEASILNLLVSDECNTIATLQDTNILHRRRLEKESGGNFLNLPVPVIPAKSIFTFFAEKFNHMTFLKIDCEGHEFDVVEQINNIPVYSRPILVEYENNYNDNNIAKLLLDLGYKPMIIFDSFAEIWCQGNVVSDISILTLDVLEHLMKRLKAQ